jgi:diacylglycerol kinase family enzyme
MASPAIQASPFPLAGRRIAAVLNRGSGRVDATCEALTREILADAGAAAVQVICVDPGGVEAALDAAAGSAEVLVVLAGDGTIRAAAERCGPDGPALVPLPGGTMNVLAHALYGPRPWPEVLRTLLAAPSLSHLSGGRAGGRLFLVSALLGVPSRWTRAREALRRRRFDRAAAWAIEALASPLPGYLRYQVGDARGRARALAVRCPLTSRGLSADEKTLEAAAIDPHSAAEAMRLGLDALFGRWRTSPAVTVAKAEAILVRRHGGVPALLDGEARGLKSPLEVRFEPTAARVLLPSRAASG